MRDQQREGESGKRGPLVRAFSPLCPAPANWPTASACYNITTSSDLREAVERLDLALGKVSGKVAPIRAENAASESRK